jgi:phosphohistidine swiveling domain-containing protein
VQLPRYRQLVAAAAAEVHTATPHRLVELIDTLGREAGIFLWYLAIVGGSAWKMEARLTRFAHRHLADVLPEQEGGAQVLLRGLPQIQPMVSEHAVQSLDWYHPLAADLPTPPSLSAAAADRRVKLAEERAAAERRCRAALADRPRRLEVFRRLLEVSQRYAVIREEQAHQFTLAWPVLRGCATRLGQHLADLGAIQQADDVYFCTRDQITSALAGQINGQIAGTGEQREIWQRQRQLAAPLTLGHSAPLIGDVIDRTVQQARHGAEATEGVIVGHPASTGRATGPVRIVHGPQDFAAFTDGDVLVAKTTAPAWTPLFARASAVVTDSGSLAAHASLVAREYGIPAVVGTGEATHRLLTGQIITVDGTAGTVALQDAA